MSEDPICSLQMGTCPHVSSKDWFCREPRALGLRDISLGDTLS